MKSFASDNNSGIDPIILESILRANTGHSVGYGDDKWTLHAELKFKEVFGPDIESLFVFNGTGANTVALQLLCRSFNSIICAETAHIYVDECGAPCKMTGAQIRPVKTENGKLTPELIKHYLHGLGDQHHSQPKVIYISQCTELGTVYTIEELKELTDFAHSNKMFIHVDGARIANAAAFLNVSLKEMTTDIGIDILSFGGTKNGMMIGESIVIFNPTLFNEAKFIRKQTSQLASKMRFISCQYIAYLENELWLNNASHANNMAKLLAQKLSKIQEIRFTQSVESNALFLQMPRQWIDELLKSYFFYFWNEDQNEIRFVTSFDTSEEDIDSLVKELKRIISITDI